MATPVYEPRIPPKIPDVPPLAADPTTTQYGGRGGPATNYGRNPKEPYIPAPFSPFYPFPPHQSGGGVPVSGFLPPNGYAGFAQQTPAVQSLYRSRGMSKRRGSRRGKKRAGGLLGQITRAVSRRKGPKKRKGSSRLRAVSVTGRAAQGRLLKGSMAAKRRMAQLRRMRRRRR